MDTAWMDLFWAEKKGTRNRSTDVDEGIFNLFRVMALITRDPEADESGLAVDILTKSQPNYATFHKYGWLDEQFTETLIPVLEAWCGNDGTLQPLLPNCNYFDEKKLFAKLTADSSSLEVTEVLQFMAYALYIKSHETDLDADAFQQWMRVIHNLVINSTNIDRAERLPGGMIGILALLPKSSSILEYLETIDVTNGIGTFAKWQLEEESIKSGLLIHHDGWEPLIDRAELHGYFRGQIAFLFDFSGGVNEVKEQPIAEWSEATHEELQYRFEEYLNKAEAMFNADGVADTDGDFIWQRALLSVGDYLFPMTANRLCLLLDAYTEANSWKRLLRGHTDHEANGRRLLKVLWDQLESDQAFPVQLRELVADVADLEPWRDALVRSCSAMAYCGKRIIRRETANQVYLLAKMQMNGAHAELFSYSLYRDAFLPMKADGSLVPLELEYWYPTDMDMEPGILINWKFNEIVIRFEVEWTGDDFKIFVQRDILAELSDVSSCLIAMAGFDESESQLSKWTHAEDLVHEIEVLRDALDSLVT